MNKILLDTYGADLGVTEMVKGASLALEARDDIELILFGAEEEIRKVLEEDKADMNRITIINATDFITNHDNPMDVFRGRDESSMVLALNYLKTHDDVQGLLSAGNTGALMVGSIARIGLQKGVQSPVLASLIPNPVTNWQLLLDCGAHLTPTAQDLVTFAKLGVNFYKATYDVANPTVGLLSVGAEESKGNELTKEAHKLLKESGLNFIGNVEGSDLQNGKADVVVADGFTGNVLLKSIESANLVATQMVENFYQKAKLDTMTMRVFEQLVSDMYQQFDMTTGGGATFLGTKKLVVKMHGSSNRGTVLACVNQILKTNVSALY